MKLSARNQIKGKVIEVRKGQTTAHVRIDVPLDHHGGRAVRDVATIEVN